MRRLDWYPLKVDGSRADPKAANDFLFFGNLVGQLQFEGLRVTSTYERVSAGGPEGVKLDPVGPPFRTFAT